MLYGASFLHAQPEGHHADGRRLSSWKILGLLALAVVFRVVVRLGS